MYEFCQFKCFDIKNITKQMYFSCVGSFEITRFKTIKILYYSTDII